jgi:hypothetical protein
MKRIMISLLVIALLLGASTVLAMSSDNYRLDWFTPLTGGGGGPASSTHYAADFTVGQSSIGPSSSTNYEVGLGYWYGIGGYRVFLPLVLRDYG